MPWEFSNLSFTEVKIKKIVALLQELKRQAVEAIRMSERAPDESPSKSNGPVCEGVYCESLIDGWATYARLPETYQREEIL